MSTKDQVLKLTDLLPYIQTRFQANMHDLEAIGMLDEVISQLEILSEEDQGICNILDGLYQAQTYVKSLNRGISACK